MLHDVKGKPQKALKIFSCIIQGLREDFTARLPDQIPNFGAGPVDHDIHWVITVPAIWDEKAKQFMRVAAKEVSLSEIEDPVERISVYCCSISDQVRIKMPYITMLVCLNA